MTIPFPLRLTISEGPFPADSLSIRRPGLELLLWKGWLCDGDCQLLRRHLLSAAIPWQQPRLRVYGREHPVPRLVCWFGDPGCSYRYSQHVHDPLPWTPPLARLRERLNDQLGNEIGRAHV